LAPLLPVAVGLLLAPSAELEVAEAAAVGVVTAGWSVKGGGRLLAAAPLGLSDAMSFVLTWSMASWQIWEAG
jgi:hypothetical protein